MPSSDGPPEITVNEMNTRENRGWYTSRHETSEQSQNSHEMPRPANNYNKKVTFDRGFSTKTASNSEPSNSSQDSQTLNKVSSEPDKDKSSQQPSVLCGSFTQIMVNLMQLQDHKFTAWLDRLIEARRNRQEK